ncbi:Ubiquitin-conjugating enzyme E2 32 [Vitis vinifera]|uniref:Ubiquitin-conjugating enzyme E2 32 n=1 Tax=Vitis vinifera TaxID=29760 RepID=A0A438E1M4_VITVI|nr:Ubiquitin-conjugating enzyme E2 32 [Vitis vinifera]
MNTYLNHFLKTCLKLFEFVKHFDITLSRIHHNEAKTEFETHHSLAVLTTKLYALEKHVEIIFKRQSFLKFRDEMKNVELFFPINTKNHGDYHVHTLPSLEALTSFGKYVMIEHLEEIPKSCILKSSMCSQMSYFASQSEKAFKEDAIFEWQNAIRGSADTEFEAGIYHGRIQLPAEYPFQHPSFLRSVIKLLLKNLNCFSVAFIAFMPTDPGGALGSGLFKGRKASHISRANDADSPRQPVPSQMPKEESTKRDIEAPSRAESILTSRRVTERPEARRGWHFDDRLLTFAAIGFLRATSTSMSPHGS